MTRKNLVPTLALLLHLAAASDALAAVFTVSNAHDSGAGSLRQAILDANADPVGEDLIVFAIPGAGPHTIHVASPLPVIRAGVHIDGRSQQGYVAAPVIELSGGAAGEMSGLVVDSNLAEVRIEALSITGFHGHGIEVRALTYDTQIRGCHIGVRPDGRTAAGNGGFGVATFGEQTVIGGSYAARNVISGNGGGGILATGTAAVAANRIGTDAAGTAAIANRGPGIRATGFSVTITAAVDPLIVSGNAGNGMEADGAARVTVSGAYIGTDATGRVAIPNGGNGVLLRDVREYAVVGGNNGAAVPVNVIAANAGHGVLVESTTGATFAAVVADNAIGIGYDLATPLGNGGDGVRIAGARGAAVGQPEAAGNTIAYNGGNGISVVGAEALGNPIRANSFAAKAGLAIDLGANGATPNDPGDTDQGPNRYQNFPIVERALFSGSMLTVTGRVEGVPSAGYAIDLFADGRYLQSVQTPADASGRATFTATASGVQPGALITATATDTTRLDTSEMSPPAVASNEAGVLHFAASATAVAEGTTASIEIVRSGGSTGTVTIEYGTLSTGGTATPGADFFTASGVVTFQPAETRKTIAIATTQDGTPEADETFVVQLRSPTGGALRGTPHTITVTIADDDAHLAADLAVRIDTPAAVEPGKAFSWRVELRNDGPGTATNARVQLTWSSLLAVTYAGPGCVSSGTSVTCTVAALAPRSSVTFELAAVPPPYVAPLSITAEASAATVDLWPADNSVTRTFVADTPRPKRRSVRQ